MVEGERPHGDGVFPTHVGVIPSGRPGSGVGCCIPHTRGGDPSLMVGYVVCVLYSPHTWG